MIDYSKHLKDDKILILLFHGVVKKKPPKILDPVSKHVTVSRFKKIILSLKKKGNSISIQDLIEKKIKKKSFIVTFDDGFYNNINILSFLKKQKVPCLFYITTDFIESNLMSWSDMIDYALYRTKKNKIIFQKKNYHINNQKKKIIFSLKVRKIVKNNMKLNSYKIAENIQKKLIGKVVKRSNLEVHKKMRWKNLKKILSEKDFDIGAHSKGHEMLTKLGDKQVAKDILQCKKVIKKKLNYIPAHFAYPDGQSNHFSSKIIRLLKKNGFISSPTAIQGLNSINTSPFMLKRFFAY